MSLNSCKQLYVVTLTTIFILFKKSLILPFALCKMTLYPIPVNICISLRENKFFFLSPIKIFTEPLIGHGKIKIVPCIKSCAQDDLVITRK